MRRCRARPSRRAAAALLGIACGVGLPAAAPLGAADVTSTWFGGTGNWGVAGNWNDTPNVPFFPNNGNGGFTYDAVLNAGTATLNLNITIQKLSLNGGTIAGANNLTLNEALSWTGGTMSGAGVTNANGGLALSSTGSPNPTLSARTLNNAGAATFAAGTFTLSNGAVFNNLNGASFAAADNSTLQQTGVGGGTFRNLAGATFSKGAGAGTATVSAAFNNAGAASVNNGTLVFSGGGTHAGGSFSVASGAALQYSGTHGFTGGSVTASGNGAVRFTGGTIDFAGTTYNVAATGSTAVSGASNVTFDSSATLQGLGGSLSVTGGSLDLSSGEAVNVVTHTQSGGTLTGSDTVGVSGMLAWSGGTMSGSGVTNANGGLAISSTGTPNPSLSARTLNNAGPATLAAGTFSLVSGATFNNLNGATFTAADGSTVQPSGVGSAFNNRAGAAFTKAAGVGTATVSAAFNNAGNASVNNGTLVFSGGGTHAGGSFTAATGTTLQFGGTHGFTGGSVTAAGTGAVRFTGGTIDFAGTTYNVAATGSTAVSGPSSNVTFNSAATLQGLGGSLSVTGGSLDLSSGEAVNVVTHTQSGGTLTGSDTVGVSGMITWSGGTMSGSGITNANGGLAISSTGSPNPTLSGRTLNNAGPATLAAGTFTLANATFNNLNGATFSAADGSTVQPSGVGSAFNNRAGATFTKAAGAGTATVSTDFNNAGGASVTSGTLLLSGGGSHTGTFSTATGTTLDFSGGHAFTGGSVTGTGSGAVRFLGGNTTFTGTTYNVRGSTTVNGGVTTFQPSSTLMSVGNSLTVGGAGTLNLNSGETVNLTALTVTQSGNLGGSDTVNVSGTTTWSGGTMAGTGTTNANGNVNLSTAAGASAPTLSARTFNSGPDTAFAGGGFTLANGGMFNNRTGATFDAQGDFAVNISGTPGEFNNHAGASFTKTGGAGLGNVLAPFNNAGNVSVTSGTLRFSGGGTHTGTFTAGSGTALEFGGGTHTFSGGSVLATANAVVRFVGAGNVTFNGTNFNVPVSSATEFIGTGTVTFPASSNIQGLGNSLTITSGTVDLSSGEPVNLSTLTVTGTGTLTGSDAVTVGDLTTFTGGTMSGTGQTIANGGLTIGTAAGATSPFLGPNRFLLNAAAGTFTGGNLTFGTNGALLNLNGATFDAQNGFTVNSAGGGTFGNLNGAQFTKTGGGVGTFNVRFNNAGNVAVAPGGGTLALGGGGTHTGGFNVAAGQFLVFRGGTHDFQSGSSVGGQGVIRFANNAVANINGAYNVGGGTVVADTATVNFNATANTTNLTLDGGTVNGRANLSAMSLTNNAGNLDIGSGTTVGIPGPVALAGGDTTIRGSIDVGGLRAVRGAGGVAGALAAGMTPGGTLNAEILIVSGGDNVCEAGGVVNVGSGGLFFTGAGSPTFVLNSDTVDPAGTALMVLGGDLSADSTGTASLLNAGAVPTAGTLDLDGAPRAFDVTGPAAVGLEVSARVTNGGIVKGGGGVMRLSQANDYVGGTVIEAGRLEAANAAALGGGPVTIAGGTLGLRSDAASTAYGFTLGAAPADSIGVDIGRITLPGVAGTFRLTGPLTLGSALNVTGADGGTLVAAGAVTLAGGASPTTFNTAAALTVEGPIGGGGGAGLTKTGTGTLRFAGTVANTYTGTTSVNAGTLELAKSAGLNAVPGLLNVFSGGTLRLVTSNQVRDTAAVTVNAGGTFDLAGQTETVAPLVNNGALGIGPGDLTVSGGGVTGAGATDVGAAGRLTANSVRQRTLTVGAGGTAAARPASTGGQTSVLTGLTLAGATDAWTGKLELNDTALIVTDGDLATVTNQVRTAANFAAPGGYWDGAGGIASAAAAADPDRLTGLGILRNNNGAGGVIYMAFEGQPAAVDDILVKYTYYGDADNSGFIGAADYALIDAAFARNPAPGTAQWSDGDSDYDGDLDAADYALMDASFLEQGGALAAGPLIAAHRDRFGSAYTDVYDALQAGTYFPPAAVPEPSAAALAVGAAALLMRRRRGRVFVGDWKSVVLAQGPGRPAPRHVSDIC